MLGTFITIEGTDGSGKTTFIQDAKKHLESIGLKVLVTREPGGTVLSEKIRELLFDNSYDMDKRTESLLFAASRSEHINKTIIPHLTLGYVILCDRFVDSSISYQSYARGLKKEDIIMINDYATAGLAPDLTLYFDVELETGLARTGKRTDNNRMDNESMEFYRNVKRGYDELAVENKDRIVTIDANKDYEQVKQQALEVIDKFLVTRNV